MGKLDLQNNINQQLIVAGMAGLIDDGLTFHEMMSVVEEIKRQCFPALMEISRENKVLNSKNGGIHAPVE